MVMRNFMTHLSFEEGDAPGESFRREEIVPKKAMSLSDSKRKIEVMFQEVNDPPRSADTYMI